MFTIKYFLLSFYLIILNADNIDKTESKKACVTSYVTRILSFELLEGQGTWIQSSKNSLSAADVTICDNGYIGIEISGYALTGVIKKSGEDILSFTANYSDGDGLSILVTGAMSQLGDEALCTWNYTSQMKYYANIYNTEFKNTVTKQYSATVTIK